MRKSHELDHTKKTASGACEACLFLERAIELQKNPEYRAEYEGRLEEAQLWHKAEKITQAPLFEEAANVRYV